MVLFLHCFGSYIQQYDNENLQCTVLVEMSSKGKLYIDTTSHDFLSYICERLNAVHDCYIFQIRSIKNIFLRIMRQKLLERLCTKVMELIS